MKLNPDFTALQALHGRMKTSTHSEGVFGGLAGAVDAGAVDWTTCTHESVFDSEDAEVGYEFCDRCGAWRSYVVMASGADRYGRWRAPREG